MFCKTVQTRWFFHRGISVCVIYGSVNVLFIQSQNNLNNNHSYIGNNLVYYVDFHF